MAKAVRNTTKIANVINTPKPVDTKLAQTIVEQGPKDEQTRLSAYGGHIGPLETQYVNYSLSKYADDLYSSYTSLTAALGLPNVNLSGLDAFKKVSTILKELDPAVLTSRIENGLLGGRSLKSIMELPEKIKKDALGTISDLTKNTQLGGLNIGQLINTGRMTYAEANRFYQTVKNGDWKSLEGISKALNAMGHTGMGQLVKSVVDFQAVGAFVGELVKTVAAFGNNELLNELKGLFKSSRDRNQAFNSALMSAAYRSDTETMKTIIQVLGGMETARNNPKAIKVVLSSYNLDPFYTPDTASQYRRRLLDVLESLNPDWCYDYQNRIRVTKLEPFSWMSDDCRKLFAYSDEVDFSAELLIAKSYTPVDIQQLAMTFYKDITFRNRPLDPREKM